MHPVDNRMSDRVLTNGGGLIVNLPVQEAQNIQVENQSIPTVRAFFFKVTKTREYQYRYTQLGSINSGNGLDFDYLGDTGLGTGSDILRLENDDFKLYHIGVGLSTPDLRVYESIDPAPPSRAVDFSNQNEPDPTSGSQFGFYDGKQQGDKFDPPEHTERVSFRNSQNGQLLQFGFYAENDVSTNETDLEISGKTYEIVPVTDPAEQEFMLQQNQIRRAGKAPALKVVSVQVAGIFPWEEGTSLPDGWQDVKEEASQDLMFRPQAPDAGGAAGMGGAAAGGQPSKVAERHRQ